MRSFVSSLFLFACVFSVVTIANPKGGDWLATPAPFPVRTMMFSAKGNLIAIESFGGGLDKVKVEQPSGGWLHYTQVLDTEPQTLFSDKAGRVYASFSANNRSPGGIYEVFTDKDKRPTRLVGASMQIAAVTESDAILGLRDGDLHVCRPDRSGWEIINVGANVFSIAAAKGKWYVGTERGVFEIDEKERRPNLLANSPLNVRALNTDGEKAIVAFGQDAKAHVYSNGQWHPVAGNFTHMLNSMQSNAAIAMVAGTSRAARIRMGEKGPVVEDLGFQSPVQVVGAHVRGGSVRFLTSDWRVHSKRAPTVVVIRAGGGVVTLGRVGTQQLLRITGEAEARLEWDFAAGDRIQLRAIAPQGMVFDRWQGIRAPGAEATVDLQESENVITAVFRRP